MKRLHYLIDLAIRDAQLQAMLPVLDLDSLTRIGKRRAKAMRAKREAPPRNKRKLR